MLALARRRRRRRWVVATLVVAVVVAYVVLKLTLLNDDVHHVTTEDALDRFRESHSTLTSESRPADSTSTLPPDAPTLPAPGVYLYATTGSESIDAVGGTTHHYPEQTTITVVVEGCGVTLRWDALVERRERWALCIEEQGIALAAEGESFHEFFGNSRTELLTCDRPVVLVPADGEPRPPEPLECLLGELTWRPSWEVLEHSRVVVAGTSVPVVHVRMIIADNDEYYEHIALDWYLDEHGLPVKVGLVKESLADTAFGDVKYVELYGLELLSLDPLR